MASQTHEATVATMPKPSVSLTTNRRKTITILTIGLFIALFVLGVWLWFTFFR